MSLGGAFLKGLVRVGMIVFLCLFMIVDPAIAEEKVDIVIKYKEDHASTLNSFSSATKQEGLIEVLSVPQEEYEEILNELKADNSIEIAEKKVFYEYFSLPNDVDYQKQIKDFNRINVPQAWERYVPQKKPIVAVIDSGIDMTHPDLKDRIYKPHNVLNPGTAPIDDVGHGTHVAGIVGAKTNNQVGIASIVKDAYIMPIKVGDASSISSPNIAKGIYYAINNGATIINLSLGGPEYSEGVHKAIKDAVNKGILVIAAAGNYGNAVEMYPAAHPEVLSVAAVNSDNDSLWQYSNYGSWVDVSAPGVDIYSTCIGGSYCSKTGTSMASPMVASLAALLKNHNPRLTNFQNRYIIEASSDYSSGNSNLYKHGRVDALEAFSLYDRENRISGPTSVDTSNFLAMTGWDIVPTMTLQPDEKSGNESLPIKTGNFAVLANNQSFPDSLSASALAFKLDAPILLTFPNRLSESTVSTLKSLDVTDVIILGGEEAIPKTIESQLTNKGFKITRLKGQNRYSTATEINNYVAKKNGEVIVASGLDFPDALSVSGYAASLQIPIVFVKNGEIPDATKDFLKKYQFEKAYVIGGTQVIADSLAEQLPNPDRISGGNRYETTVEVNNYFSDGEPEGFLISTGRNFPDALAAGVLSAKENKPLLLVEKSTLPSSIEQYMTEKRNASLYGLSFQVIGGTAAVQSNVKWDVDRIIYDDYYESAYMLNSNAQEGRFQSKSNLKKQ